MSRRTGLREHAGIEGHAMWRVKRTLPTSLPSVFARSGNDSPNLQRQI